jgi:hypothetical protein
VRSPLLGDARDQILLQQPAEPLEQGRADPGDPLGQGAEPGRQHGAPGRHIEILPQAAAMEAGQVQGQLGHQGRRHGPGHGVAIAGGHPVDDPLLRQQPVEEVGAALDAGHKGGIRVEHRLGMPLGQGHHLLYGEPACAKGDQGLIGLLGGGSIRVHHESAARNRRS